MWVPPCDCGVKPMPPKPASRPECISTRVTSAAEISTWVTAKNGDHRAGWYQRLSATLLPHGRRRTMRGRRSSVCSSPGTTGSSRAWRSRRCARATSGARGGPRGGARGRRAAARRDQARRSREARSEQSSSTRSACRLTSCASAALRAARFGRGSCAAASSAAASARRRRPDRRGRLRPRGTNSGGPPTLVATTDRPEARPSSVARPNGSARLGWQTTSAAAIQAATRS